MPYTDGPGVLLQAMHSCWNISLWYICKNQDTIKCFVLFFLPVAIVIPRPPDIFCILAQLQDLGSEAMLYSQKECHNTSLLYIYMLLLAWAQL